MTPWLIAGLFVGLTTAMMGLIELNTPELRMGDDVVATVGEQSISRQEYEDALATVATDRRAPLSEAARQHVLDQLINETMLAQYGRDLELPLRSPRLRDALVDEVLEMTRLEAESERIGEDALRAYLQAHPERFRGPDLLHVEAWYAADEATAEAARTTLQSGEAQAGLKRAIVPEGPVPADTLRDYLGPEAARAAQALDPGAVSAPLVAGDAVVLLRLLARRPAPAARFADVENALREAVQHDRAEALLAGRLDALRTRYEVEVRRDAH